MRRLLLAVLLVGCAPDEPAASSGLAWVDGEPWIAAETGLVGTDVRGDVAAVVPWGEGAAASVRADGAVVFVDADGRETSRVAVGAEPAGLLGGRTVTVALAMQDEVVRLDEGGVLERVATPDEPRWLARAGRWTFVAGARARVLRWGDGAWQELDPPTVTATVDGEELRWTPRFTGDPAVADDGSAMVWPLLYVNHTVPVGSGGYDRVANQPRFRPALWRVEVGADGPVDAGLRELLPERTDDGVLRGGYVGAVALGPDGVVAAALTTGDALVTVDQADRVPAFAVAPGGPAAVAWNDGWWAYGRRTGELTGPRGTEPVTEPLHPELAEGRRLFETSADPAISGPGSGLSCSTCHFGGRDDGLTWALESGNRQTPSLAGPTADTAPFTWTEGVASVAGRALETSARRMGGLSLSAEQAQEVAGWIEAIARPALPAVDVDAAERGRRLFEDPAAGCADCHPAPTFSDGEAHELFGLDAVDTPTLRGIAATAPYLHDGSSPTLRAVLVRSRDGAMGDTGGLDDDELADLEAYLRSL